MALGKMAATIVLALSDGYHCSIPINNIGEDQSKTWASIEQAVARHLKNNPENPEVDYLPPTNITFT